MSLKRIIERLNCLLSESRKEVTLMRTTHLKCLKFVFLPFFTFVSEGSPSDLVVLVTLSSMFLHH